MRLIILPLLIGIFIFSCRPASADSTAAANKARADHMRDMAELKRSEPSEYERIHKLQLLQLKMLLARLGYDVGPFDLSLDSRVVVAIKTYEKNRGIPVTGDPLAFDMLRQVATDRELVDTNLTYPTIPHFFDMFWDSGTVFARGTWAIDGDAVAEPEQYTSIQCEKAAGKCYVSTALKGGSGSGTFITSRLEIFEVARWDSVEIVTEPYDFMCTRYVLRINRLQKSTTGTRSKVSNSSQCNAVENRELTLKLANGNEVVREIRLKHRREMLGLFQISPDVNAILASARE